MDFKKLKDLLKGSPDYQPNMGDVKQADRATGLGVKPQLVRGYGEDQDTMDLLKESARRLAKSGISSNEPGEKELKQHKMIESMTGGALGTVGKADDILSALKNVSKPKQIENLTRLRNEAYERMRNSQFKPDMVDAFNRLNNLYNRFVK